MSRPRLNDQILGSEWKVWNKWIDDNLSELSESEREWFGWWDQHETHLRGSGINGATGVVGTGISEIEISAQRVGSYHGWVVARAKPLLPIAPQLVYDGSRCE